MLDVRQEWVLGSRRGFMEVVGLGHVVSRGEEEPWDGRR